MTIAHRRARHRKRATISLIRAVLLEIGAVSPRSCPPQPSHQPSGRSGQMRRTLTSQLRGVGIGTQNRPSGGRYASECLHLGSQPYTWLATQTKLRWRFLRAGPGAKPDAIQTLASCTFIGQQSKNSTVQPDRHRKAYSARDRRVVFLAIRRTERKTMKCLTICVIAGLPGCYRLVLMPAQRNGP